MSVVHKVKTRNGRNVHSRDDQATATQAAAEARYYDLNDVAAEAADRYEAATTAVEAAAALADMAAVEEEQGRLNQLAFGPARSEAELAEWQRQSGLLMRFVALTFLARLAQPGTLEAELDRAEWLTEADDDLVQAVWPALAKVADATNVGERAVAMRAFADAAAPYVGHTAGETAHWLADITEAQAAGAAQATGVRA